MDPNPADVITAIAGLKPLIAMCIIGGAVIIAALWLLTRYLEHKWTVKREAIAARRSEEGKAARAAATTAAWNNLATEIRSLRTDSQSVSERIEKRALDDAKRTASLTAAVTASSESSTRVHESVLTLQAIIRDMAARQTGGINRADSMRLIEQIINDVVMRDAMDILGYSLRKNDYANRAEYIKTKVRTEIGRSILRAAAGLREYRHLSVSPAYYLTYYFDEGVRFNVCDELWRKIEPLYRQHANHQGEERRLEEMRVIVGNVFGDLVTLGRRSAEDYYSQDPNADPDPQSVFRSATTDDIPQPYRRQRSEILTMPRV